MASRPSSLAIHLCYWTLFLALNKSPPFASPWSFGRRSRLILNNAVHPSKCTLSSSTNNSTEEFSSPDHDVIIVGGSIVGLATAVTLLNPALPRPDGSSHQKSSIRTHVYERASSLRPAGALLSLFPNGRTALKCILGSLSSTLEQGLSLVDVIDRQAIPLERTIIKAVKNGIVVDEQPASNNVQKPKDGETKNTTDDKKDGTAGTFILWHQLQSILLEALTHPEMKLQSVVNESFFSLGCEFLNYTVDNSTGWVHATFARSNHLDGIDSSRSNRIIFTKTCRVLIGADGIRSTIRPQILSRHHQQKLHPDSNLPMHQNLLPSRIGIRSYQRIVFRALIDSQNLPHSFIDIPRGVAILYKSATNVGQVFKLWSCSEGKLIALTSTASTKSDDEDATNSNVVTEETVREWKSSEVKSRWKAYFHDFPPEILDIIERVTESAIFANCVSDLDVRYDEGEGASESFPCDDNVEQKYLMLSWCNGIDPVVLIGDGAHATTPSLGQGANVGLEDAVELGSLLRHELSLHGTDPAPKQQQATASARLYATMDGMTNEKILKIIDKFRVARNDRVVEIHKSSQEQALTKSVKDSSLKGYRSQNEDFFRRLYQWSPSLGR